MSESQRYVYSSRISAIRKNFKGPKEEREYIFRFFISHELGHAVQSQTGVIYKMPFFDAEMEASIIASSWHALRYPKDRDRLILDTINWFGLPDESRPDFGNQSPSEWIESNYSEIQKEGTKYPLAYAWFQQEILKTIYLDYRSINFCKFLERYK